MRNISVSEASKDGVFYELHAIHQTFSQLNNPQEKVIFNLSHVKSIPPALAVAISTYVQATNSAIIPPENVETLSYLKTIGFPMGKNPLEDKYVLADQCTPITFIKKTKDATERDKMTYSFLDIIWQFIKDNKNIKNALYYPIGEFVNNIFEHSKKNIGCVFAQEFPESNSIEICIADSGRGIKKSYKEELNLDFPHDIALVECLMGHSTKSADRGFGVRTSKDIICRGLKGEFMLISGQAVYAASGNDEFIPNTPGFNWQGVIIYYRFSKPEKNIDINKYLE